MIDLGVDCDVFILSDKQVISGFDCGNADLNEFFNRRTGKRELWAIAIRNFAYKIYVLRYATVAG